MPTLTATGEQISVELTMHNQGTEPTAGVYGWWWNEYWLSTDTQLGGDTLLAQPRFYGGLAAGETKTETVLLDVPFIAGTYYLIAVVDKVNSTGVVPESDETNNTIVSGPITIEASDLMPTALTAPTVTGTGQTIETELTMVNNGPGYARSRHYSWWYNEYYLSTDTQLGGDILLGQPRHYATVAPGDSTTQSLALTMPFVSGTYYLIAVVDKVNAGQTVDETDETNNIIVTGPIEVLPSDLIAMSIDAPTLALPGETIEADFEMYNDGPGNARSKYYSWWWNEYYLSTDPVRGGDTFISQPRIYANLAPGESTWDTVPVTMPTTPGEYYLIFIVDKVNATQTVDETDETNNTLVFGPILVDDDVDDDGFTASFDCNDFDATVYPGAPEIKHDGIDQDCNGYDLTIEITKAVWSQLDPTSPDEIKVEASSAWGELALLELDGFGPMSWKENKGVWTLAEGGVDDPITVTVCGFEGCETAEVLVEQ